MTLTLGLLSRFSHLALELRDGMGIATTTIGFDTCLGLPIQNTSGREWLVCWAPAETTASFYFPLFLPLAHMVTMIVLYYYICCIYPSPACPNFPLVFHGSEERQKNQAIVLSQQQIVLSSTSLPTLTNTIRASVYAVPSFSPGCSPSPARDLSITIITLCSTSNPPLLNMD